jgi:ribonuclease HI
MKSIEIYTDGASRGNPGPGGWGAVILAQGYAMEIAGSVQKATNNQMELQAVLEVLSDSGAKSSTEPINVYSDSAYVVNGLNNWVYGWEKKGWKTTQKTPVENKEIWIKLLDLINFYGKRLNVKKVSGHAGDLYNERCDELAVNSALGKKQDFFKGTIPDYEKYLETIGTTAKKKNTKTKKTSSSAKAYSYVSLVDGKVYVDSNWKDCEKRVKGKPAKFKKVFSKEEEIELVQMYKNHK